MSYINIELGGINHSDAPDYCDVYVEYAEHEDGTPLTDEELDKLSDDQEFVYDRLMEQLY